MLLSNDVQFLERLNSHEDNGTLSPDALWLLRHLTMSGSGAFKAAASSALDSYERSSSQDLNRRGDRGMKRPLRLFGERIEPEPITLSMNRVDGGVQVTAILNGVAIPVVEFACNDAGVLGLNLLPIPRGQNFICVSMAADRATIVIDRLGNFTK